MISDEEHEHLVQTSEDCRNAYFESLGLLDGSWCPIVNPRFMEGAVWPTRPGWQRITNSMTTMIVSSGLTDPWYESEVANNGLGVEILVATNDDLPTDLMQIQGTWLFLLATAISNAAVTDGLFAQRFEKFGHFLFGVSCFDGCDVPSNWICYDNCFGFLVGMTIPKQSMTFPLPTCEAHLLTAKLLTPAEYHFAAENGPEGAATLRDLFLSDGSYHLSSLCRISVV